jgi:hypothetical protein
MPKRLSEMSKEELMAEVMGLGQGVRPRKRKFPIPERKPRKKPRPRKTASPLSPSHYTNLPAEKQCESIPLKQELTSLGLPPLSPLPSIIPSSYINEVKGGFGAKEVAGQPINKRMVRGKRVHIPWDMFSYRDIAEYLRCDVERVKKVLGLHGWLKRVPGRRAYAPITRDQAKAVMHHILLGRGE